jgi:hypothetical protein
MIPLAPTFAGVPTQVLDMTNTIAPLAGTMVVGLFLTSLAGIVLTILLDRWQSQRQAKLAVVPTADAVAFSKAA